MAFFCVGDAVMAVPHSPPLKGITGSLGILSAADYRWAASFPWALLAAASYMITCILVSQCCHHVVWHQIDVSGVSGRLLAASDGLTAKREGSL
jgi:hypothetical protein